MAEDDKKPGLKSAGAKTPLRSRGFLSHGGVPAKEGEPEKPKRSRGMLSHTSASERDPQELDAPKPRRPYSLEPK